VPLRTGGDEMSSIEALFGHFVLSPVPAGELLLWG
jgi:hypothetical protein